MDRCQGHTTTKSCQRDGEGKFIIGHKGYSGRPKGGRSVALDLLDKICSESATLLLFETALRERLEAEPLKFYREFVVALAPKQLDIDLPIDSEWATKTPSDITKDMDNLTTGDEQNV